MISDSKDTNAPFWPSGAPGTHRHTSSIIGEICLCCCSRAPKGSGLVLEGGVHIQLAGMDHRVFWQTHKRKKEGPKRC